MPKKGQLIIAVTGTPAAGKTTFAESLCEAIKVKPIEVNNIVESKLLFTGIDENESKIVKMEELEDEIKKVQEAGDPVIVLVGHLLCDLRLKYDIAIVVRAKLTELILRMEERSYSKEKVKENLVSESIDYCGAQVAEKAKETYEVEGDEEKALIIDYIKERAAGGTPKPPKLSAINKMDEMLELVYNDNVYGL